MTATIELRDILTATQLLRSKSLAEYNFSISATPVVEIVDPGETSVEDDKDSNVTTHEDETVNNLFNVSLVETVPGTLDGAPQFSAIDPATRGPSSVATIDQYGHMTYLADGVVRVMAKTQWLQRAVNLPVSQAMTTGTKVWNHFVEGSAGKDAYDRVTTGIVGKVPGASAQRMWIPYNNSIPAYAWNTATFLPGVDLTCISPWNSDQGHQKSGTLVSPRHVVFAAHYIPACHTRIRFLSSDNELYEGTLVDVEDVAPLKDMAVGILDADVPEGISFARVLPSDMLDTYFPGKHYEKMPAIVTNQHKDLLIHALAHLDDDEWSTSPPSVDEFLPFYAIGVKGDSGSPAFLVLDGQLALLGTLTGGDGGPTYGSPTNLSEVNAVMASLSTAHGLSAGEITAGDPYQLTEFDLSAFDTY